MEWLNIENLVKKIGQEKVLDRVNFSMAANERLAIMGATGSGKTSLLKVIAGLMQAESGNVFFEGKKVAGPLETLIPGHPGIAYLSQYFELRPNFFIHELLSYANTLSQMEAEEIYTLCEINHLLNRKSTELSGGEKQRVALARLLSTRPKLLILDEPFSHLDLPHKTVIKRVLDNSSHTMGFSIMVVSHDASDILPWASRLLILKDGVILEDGHPQTLYQNPRYEYTANMTGIANWLSPEELYALFPAANIGNTSHYMIRPEQVRLQEDSGHGVEATIEKMAFGGMFDWVTVIVKNIRLICPAPVNKYKINDKVFIYVSAEHIVGI